MSHCIYFWCGSVWKYSEVRNFMFSSTSLFNCRLLSAHGSSEYTAAAASRHTTTLQTRRAEPQTLRIHWHDHTLELVSKCECKVACVVAEGQQYRGRVPRHDVPHQPHGQHVAGGGGRGPVLAPAGPDQGDHDQLPEGDCGEHPELPQDREGDLPRVQGGGHLPAGRHLGGGLRSAAW